MPPDLWLMFAPIKKARTDFIVEKATELGAARILPVQTAHTNSERIRQDRLQAHAVEAAEQCGGTCVPEVADLQPLSRLLDRWPADRHILWCNEHLAGVAHALPRDGAPGGGGLWTTTMRRLLKTGKKVKAEAEATRDPNAPAVAGEHCKFCLISATCRAHYDKALDAAGITALDFYSETIPKVETADRLTPDELSKRLRQAEHLKRWISSIESYALAEAVEGRPPAGFKAVEGRGSRVLRDTAAAIETLAGRFELPQDAFFERSPLSVAQIEKFLGKKALKETAPDLWHDSEKKLWRTEPGKPSLVSLSDPRPAIDKAQMFDVVEVSAIL
jgi:hypothetical protein